MMGLVTAPWAGVKGGKCSNVHSNGTFPAEEWSSGGGGNLGLTLIRGQTKKQDAVEQNPPRCDAEGKVFWQLPLQPQHRRLPLARPPALAELLLEVPQGSSILRAGVVTETGMRIRNTVVT